MAAKMPSAVALENGLETGRGLKLRLKPTPTKTATTPATTASATKPPALRTRADFQIEFDFEFDLKITVNKHSKTNVKLVTTNIAKPLSMQLTVIVSTHFQSFENRKFSEIFENCALF